MRDKVTKLLDNRLVYILVSIIAAFVLWLWVVNAVNPDHERTLSLSIHYEGIGVLEQYNLRLASNTPNSVWMRVTASAEDLRQIDQHNMQIIVDVSDITEPGEHDARFRLSGMNLMTGTVDIIPVGNISNTDNTIIVHTNRVTGQRMDLETGIIGFRIADSQADYFFMGEPPTVYPETIQIDGPDDILAQIGFLEVDTEFLAPLSETTTQPGALRVYDHDREPIPEEYLAEVRFSGETLYDARVSVTVAVSMVREVELRPVFAYGAGANEYNLRYQLSQDTVLLRGEGDALRERDYLLLAKIHLDQIPDTLYSVRLDIPLLPLTVIHDGDDFVDIEIQIRDVEERQMRVPSDRVAFIGTPEGMAASAEVDTITIYIRGPEEILEELDVNDITIVVNLIDYEGRTGRLMVETFSVRVNDWPSETVGAMVLPGVGIIVNLQPER